MPNEPRKKKKEEEEEEKEGFFLSSLLPKLFCFYTWSLFFLRVKIEDDARTQRALTEFLRFTLVL